MGFEACCDGVGWLWGDGINDVALGSVVGSVMGLRGQLWVWALPPPSAARCHGNRRRGGGAEGQRRKPRAGRLHLGNGSRHVGSERRHLETGRRHFKWAERGGTRGGGGGKEEVST